LSAKVTKTWAVVSIGLGLISIVMGARGAGGAATVMVPMSAAITSPPGRKF